MVLEEARVGTALFPAPVTCGLLGENTHLPLATLSALLATLRRPEGKKFYFRNVQTLFEYKNNMILNNDF